MTDHLFLKSEAVPLTFQTPAGEIAIPVMSKSRELGQNWLDVRETSTARDLYDSEHGARRPAATIEFRCQAEYMLVLLKSLMNVITTSQPDAIPSPTVYDHVFYVNDGAVFNTFSMQTQESRNGTTRTLNWRGCIVASAEFTFEQDAFGTVSISIIAAEVTPAGTAFENGDTSIAAITVTTPPAVKRSLGFPNVKVTVGGTMTLDGTTKRYSVAGGTVLTGIETLTIALDHGLESRVFLDAIYPQSHVHGNREVTFTMTLADDTPILDYFHTKIVTKTTEAFFVQIDNGAVIEDLFTEQFDLTIPNALYREPSWEDISGEHGVKNLEVSGVGLWKSEIGSALHLQLRDDIATIS